MSENSDAVNVCKSCGESLEITNPAHCLSAGTKLQNRYVMGMVIGQGGFGITYSGIDNRLNIRVCIKEYYPSGIVNRSVLDSNDVISITNENAKDNFKKGRERFLTEARLLAQLSDEPGIVNVSDYFEENNTAYIVMEFVQGRSLKEYLKSHGKLTEKEAVELLYPVMLSLDAVHKKGLIHRDISPDNIMLSRNQIKLIDFGAARDSVGNDNKSMSVMLKPGYAPEEQYRRNKGVQGPWTDIYALCATFYVCMTGKRPEDSLERLVDDDLVPMSQLGAECDEQFEKVILKGLSVMQRDRYQSVSDMISDMKKIEGLDLPETAMYLPDIDYDQEQADKHTIPNVGEDASDDLTILNENEDDHTILDEEEDDRTILDEDDGERTVLYEEDDERTVIYEEDEMTVLDDERTVMEEDIEDMPLRTDDVAQVKTKRFGRVIGIMIGVVILLIVLIAFLAHSISDQINSKDDGFPTITVKSTTMTTTIATTTETVTDTESETETTTTKKKKKTKKETTTTTWADTQPYSQTWTQTTTVETEEPKIVTSDEEEEPVDTEDTDYTDPPSDTDPYIDPPEEPQYTDPPADVDVWS